MRAWHLLVLSALLLALAGCNASGAAFVKAEIPEGKAVVYIYRVHKVVGSGVVYRVRDLSRLIEGGEIKLTTSEKDGLPVVDVDDMKTVYAQGKVLTALGNGAYFAVAVKPGRHHYLVENANIKHDMWKAGSYGHTNHVVTIEAVPGKSYYIRTWIGGGARPYLELADHADGAEEVQECVMAEPGDPDAE